MHLLQKQCEDASRVGPGSISIGIITPAPARSRLGNRVTALRWARLLRELGHRVWISREYTGRSCDMLVALHARRSHDSIRRFVDRHPRRPVVVALTGTDLYGDIHTHAHAQRSLELATRLVVLQPQGLKELPAAVRNKTRVIYQSVMPLASRRRPRADAFEICVVGHLRPVKDPFRAAMASRHLPADSRMRVLHVGAALEPAMAERANREMKRNPRYRWVGEWPRWKTRQCLARSRLLVITSKMEGGANVLSEAIVDGVPVVSSRIGGSVGILGPDYPAYFPVGDSTALARLLTQVETDDSFRQQLADWCARLAPLFDPANEVGAWCAFIDQLRHATSM